MGGTGLSDDRLIEIALATLVLACIVAGVRGVTTPGKRLGGIALLTLGALVAAALYFFATFTVRLF